MRTPPVAVDPDESLLVARSLMRHYGVDELPVTRCGRIVGMVSAAQIRGAGRRGPGRAERAHLARRVAEVAAGPGPALAPDDPWTRAARALGRGRTCLPVLVRATLVGTVTRAAARRRARGT